MRIRTLIATADTAYNRHISDYISEHHADSMEISVCNTAQQLSEITGERRYDVALMDATLARHADLRLVNLPMLMWADGDTGSAEASAGLADKEEPAADGKQPAIRHIKKHRRISLLVAEILEQYAAVTGKTHISTGIEGSITAVWSPCGGVGKTTVALAYAASKAAREKEVFYLNLETFSTTHVYFDRHGKSISSVFEMLEGNDGNIKMLISGIRGCKNGITYLCAPSTFDDVCILSPGNVRELVTCCAEMTGELVIDLSCVCDARTRQVFELADKVLLVADSSQTAKTKMAQFVSQSDAYGSIKGKALLVINKSASLTETDNGMRSIDCASKPVILLPDIDAADEEYVYKTLAGKLGTRD